MKKVILSTIFYFLVAALYAQKLLVSGPMLGYIEHREALIWLEVAPSVKTVFLQVKKKGNAQTQKMYKYEGTLGKAYNPIKIALEGLDMDTEYSYDIYLNGVKQLLAFPTQFKTKRLWEWREPAPDFSFLVGSCFYINDSLYDRPGRPYGQDLEILHTMGNMPSDFMLWTGDNLYFREADYSSAAGMMYRYSYNFRLNAFQKLRGTRANYAIWDDHDYGPNDSDKSYELKGTALDIFKLYWGNKTFGEPDNLGVYHKFKWSDCDFFMLDDRFHRSADNMPELINGQPNPDKVYYGKKQIEWLKNSLISSQATFKFIVSGNQMLNPMAKDKECFMAYPIEWNDVMRFIKDNKITGVVFISGDRHFSEMLVYKQSDFYPLYEFTCSAVTSGVANIKNSKEFNNPDRVEGTLLLENNFGKISVSGAKGNRKVTFETMDGKGAQKWQFSVNEKDLK